MPTVTICMVITGIVFYKIRNILEWGMLNKCEEEKYQDGKKRFEPYKRAGFGRRMVGKI